MKKAYVVMKKGYEYDDNIYNETEGGTPKIICFSKKDAMEKVKELNIKSYMESSITDFAYEYEECVNVEWSDFEKFNKSLIEKYGEIEKTYKWDSTENRLHSLANEDEINEYCKMVNISFYDMVETDVDLQSLRSEQINSIL
jgi:DNA replicative helicase MCM subunit Mcm2 (Cdc46/Mcm family)